MKNQEKKLSAEFCEKNGIAIISNNNQFVTIGYVTEVDEDVKERIERYFLPEKNVDFIKIEKDEFDVKIRRLYSGSSDYREIKKTDEKENETVAAKAAPAVNLLRSILSEGIMKGASDIHIDILTNETKIRFRKDGKLFPMLITESEKGKAVIARIKLLSDMNILEHRRCQDGRFEYTRNGFSYDIRVSVIPGIEGESVVLRILGGDMKAPDLENLGFKKKELAEINRMMNLESGLILVAGPTGSGKTTTLASIISRLNKEDVNIITVEDPVEYRIKNVLQISVEEEIGRTFFEILKRLLRHDPDILMVGEIRDEDTAAMACRMALTGHLVFASIHTASCEETPLRLVDMGVPVYIVAAVLKGVISQRLIDKNGGGRCVKADIKYFETQTDVRSLCTRTF